MREIQSEDVLARLSASTPRRVFALAVLFCLGGLLIYLGFVGLGGFIARGLLVLLGGSVIFLAEKMRQQSNGELVLTAEGVLDQDGNLLVPFAQIQRVERGVFAAKPSNGFTLVTIDKMQRAWVPGIWWRLGRRFGVGGISSAGASKFMAEQISLRLSR